MGRVLRGDGKEREGSVGIWEDVYGGSIGDNEGGRMNRGEGCGVWGRRVGERGG